MNGSRHTIVGPLTARAFTLIELLIVITIIGIVTSLLLMVINMVRFSARKLACANNMHHLHLILVSHANDRQGRLMQMIETVS